MSTAWTVSKSRRPFWKLDYWPGLLHLLQIILLPCAILAFSRSFLFLFGGMGCFALFVCEFKLDFSLGFAAYRCFIFLSVLGFFLSDFWSGAYGGQLAVQCALFVW